MTSKLQQIVLLIAEKCRETKNETMLSRILDANKNVDKSVEEKPGENVNPSAAIELPKIDPTNNHFKIDFE